MSANDGGPIFPFRHEYLEGECQVVDSNDGMSLRDYFAAQAMMGMQARDCYDAGQAAPEQRADLAYIEADAMLAERAKGGA